jgi:hypothetical protein
MAILPRGSNHCVNFRGVWVDLPVAGGPPPRPQRDNEFLGAPDRMKHHQRKGKGDPMIKSEMAKKSQVDRKKALCLFLILFGISAFTGCLAKKVGSEGLNKRINVFDLVLYSASDDKNIRGIVPRKEPCLKGFDYFYDPLDISVGYGTNDRIRKITTRNKQTSMFDIHAGDNYPKAKGLILRTGFSEGDTPYKFVKNGFLFTLLVDERDQVFGMTLEVLE